MINNGGENENSIDLLPQHSNNVNSKPTRSEKVSSNYDHLSVVSEECLSNGDDQMNNKNIDTNTKFSDDAFSAYQSTVPPLAHFENLSYKDIGPNIGMNYEL